jgi:hypothetical protein
MELLVMAHSSSAKRWFGAAERPLRRAVVEGIDDGARVNGQFEDLENPFERDTSLMTDWLHGTAVIVSVLRTGEWVATSEFFDVTFEVSLPGIERYRLVQRQLIAERALQTWEVGVRAAILVNPADHTKAVLV